MADVPTAKEQGYDVTWPVVRGYYMGPDVSAGAFNWWKDAFDKCLLIQNFMKYCEQQEFTTILYNWRRVRRIRLQAYWRIT